MTDPQPPGPIPPLFDAARRILATILRGEPVFGLVRRCRQDVMDLQRAIAATERHHGARCMACGKIVNLTNPSRPRVRPDPHWHDPFRHPQRLVEPHEVTEDDLNREIYW